MFPDSQQHKKLLRTEYAANSFKSIHKIISCLGFMIPVCLGENTGTNLEACSCQLLWGCAACSLLKPLGFVFILKPEKFDVPTYVHKEHFKELLWLYVKTWSLSASTLHFYLAETYHGRMQEGCTGTLQLL